jgi:hypothetical protein
VFTSSGKLIYSDPPAIRLVVEIDPDIAKYYRSLIPPYIHYSIPMYPPHISVIRRETPPNMTLWQKHHGEAVSFEYDPYVFIGRVYIWLKVWSKEIEDLRLELGLEAHSNITRPPDESPCFHTTIANFKSSLRDLNAG